MILDGTPYTIVISDVASIIGRKDAILERLTDACDAYGGRLQASDNGLFVAHFGGVAHAERAVRAALAMVAELTAYYYEAHSRQRSTLRVAVDTFEAHEKLSAEQYPLVYEAAAQANNDHNIIISHQTYRLVRGVFDIDALEAIDPADRLHTNHYVVRRARPRAFRFPMRHIAGKETHIVGRLDERNVLKETLEHMLNVQKLQVLSVFGDAGLGKSRLIYDFQNYLELIEHEVWLFRAQNVPLNRHQPYGLIRNLFTFRFEILSSDTTATARQALVRGIQRFIPDQRGEAIAHYIGQLIGLNFMYSDHIRRLQETGQAVTERAIDALAEFFRAVADDDPVMIFIQQIDLADDASIEALRYVFQRCQNSPITFMCTIEDADSFSQRVPRWGENFYDRVIHLNPLPDEAIAIIAQDILDGICELSADELMYIVQDVDGNPLHVEERLLELYQRGVLKPDAASKRAVHLQKETTLQQVTRNRIKILPEPAAYVLQRAACIGEWFWVSALLRLVDGMTPLEVEDALAHLESLNFIVQYDNSSFAATTEYRFKHDLIYQAAYSLGNYSNTDHALVANWRIEHSAQRVNEYAGILAERYRQAEKHVQASEYYIRAGKQAETVLATAEACHFYAAALELLDETSISKRANLSYALGKLYYENNRFEDAHIRLKESMELTKRIGDQLLQANILTALGQVTFQLEGRSAAEPYFNDGLELARAIGDRRSMSENLMNLGELALDDDDFDYAQQCFRESLSIYQTIRHEHRIATIFLSMGRLSLRSGNLEEAVTMSLTALRIAHRNQVIRLLLTAMVQIAEIKLQRGQTELAMDIIFTVQEHPFITQQIRNRIEKMAVKPSGKPRDTAEFKALVESLL